MKQPEDMMTLCIITKALSGKFGNNCVIMKDKEESIIVHKANMSAPVKILSDHSQHSRTPDIAEIPAH